MPVTIKPVAPPCSRWSFMNETCSSFLRTILRSSPCTTTNAVPTPLRFPIQNNGTDVLIILSSGFLGNTQAHSYPFTLTESAASSPCAAEPAAAAFCHSGLDHSFWQPHSLLRSFVPVRHIPPVSSLKQLKDWIRPAPVRVSCGPWLTDWPSPAVLPLRRALSLSTRALPSEAIKRGRHW